MFVLNVLTCFIFLIFYLKQQIEAQYFKGILLIFKKIIEIENSFIEKLVSNNQIIQNIIENYLFSVIQIENSILQPKCKHQDIRNLMYNLLIIIQQYQIKQNIQSYDIYDFIKKFIQQSFWRIKQKINWQIRIEQEQQNEQNTNQFVGLKNLGSTCYMNSLIQQLYMIKEFSQNLMKVKIEDDNLQENVLFQLNQLFNNLNYSQKQYIEAKEFCQAFKDYQGNPINVTQQMDVDEFFNTLMDKLETILQRKNQENIIKNIFEGQLSNELIGADNPQIKTQLENNTYTKDNSEQGCSHKSERKEAFLVLSLPIENKRTLNECLESFVQGEMLSGDNQYKCDKCQKKVNTLKRQSIKKLPNVLIIALKRFKFDLETMQKTKVNSYCKFPDKLNLKQYTQQYINEQEKSKIIIDQDDQEQDNKTDKENNNNSINENNQEEQQKNPEEEKNSIEQQSNIQSDYFIYDDDYYDYNLRGIVIHQGNTEAGHYYSLIKHQNQKWYEFNDTQVVQFDENEIQTQAFGSDESQDKIGFGKKKKKKHYRNKSIQIKNNFKKGLIKTHIFYFMKEKNIYTLLNKRLKMKIQIMKHKMFFKKQQKIIYIYIIIIIFLVKKKRTLYHKIMKQSQINIFLVKILLIIIYNQQIQYLNKFKIFNRLQINFLSLQQWISSLQFYDKQTDKQFLNFKPKSNKFQKIIQNCQIGLLQTLQMNLLFKKYLQIVILTILNIQLRVYQQKPQIHSQKIKIIFKITFNKLKISPIQFMDFFQNFPKNHKI
ncbi:ubiquitin carboxyl-terminal hydrolase family protein, putative [Ichthyophthirius multifiliis]|uniref:Ubiquitin carboxyl-terminal hydrolase n=1 Tax=Ichthyophthirius multifiliis TaxID=5932 RepID=G0R343_ICHMU|nr:ubiquitin carboxyl-terminal hydrolase family protein, putative [Ichthyophthirius multifiliis]EGR28119.1 ubiquitin carboxyl-terminal hydrolase family protein, putative [Ichthyophthirius multifiliis]|eukprot:XP_004027464.1 ubiquitin carboxyl-terminal hydrolase family protein, putative [Ichthyophthirius multifiliis]